MTVLFATPHTTPSQNINYAEPVAQAFDLCNEPSMMLSHSLPVTVTGDAWLWRYPMTEWLDVNSKPCSSSYPHCAISDSDSATPSPGAAHPQKDITKDADYFSQSTQDSRSCQGDVVMPTIRTDPRSYSTSRPRPHECCHCPRTFARRHDLERHTRVHTGVKPYICPCCLKAFPRSDARGRHFRNEVACRHGPQVLAFIKKNIRSTI